MSEITLAKTAGFCFGGFSIYGNMVFDMGFVIRESSVDGEIVFKYNKIIKEVFDDKDLMKGYFFGPEKMLWYTKEIEAGRLEVAPIQEIAKDIRDTMKRFDVEILSAYNVSFDMGAITETSMKYNGGLMFDFEGSQVWDLYHMACHALQGNDNYLIFATENKFIKPSGNLRSDAEAVYSFVKNSPAFIEDHTALSDCIIENEILTWVMKQEELRGTMFNKTPSSQAWRLVQKRK